MLSLEHIEEAHRVIEPVFLHTPQFTDAELSRRVGAEIVVKVETLNPIRSFKGRGADYLMHDLAPDRQIVCASAGNFGQAMAYAGRSRGALVRVFAATSANPAKVACMRQLGAEVILTGEDFDAAKDAARAYATRRPDCLFVEDGQEPRIAEGAGTIGVELRPSRESPSMSAARLRQAPAGRATVIGVMERSPRSCSQGGSSRQPGCGPARDRSPGQQ